MPELLVNASATGAGKTWSGGPGSFTVAGTFSGATVTLQTLAPDAVTWVPVQSDGGVAIALTAPGSRPFAHRPGQLRVEVSGGTPSGLYASAWR